MKATTSTNNIPMRVFHRSTLTLKAVYARLVWKSNSPSFHDSADGEQGRERAKRPCDERKRGRHEPLAPTT